jgi:hypothetical protein
MKRVLGGLLVASALAGGVAPAADGATFTVNRDGDMSDTDSGDGVCDSQPMLIRSQCTLRAALEEAAADSQSDLIRFNLPSSSDLTISPATELPPIDTPVTIDGYTQPGSSPNTKRRGTNAVPLIQLEGSAAGGAIDGLKVLDGSDGTEISGLVIRGFDEGISLESAVDETAITGNFIGTGPDGETSDGNAIGIALRGTQNLVGGSEPADRNLISGNDFDGVGVSGDLNSIVGNLIGTGPNGRSDLGNGDSGIYVIAGRHTISRNVIAFNRDEAGEADGVTVENGASGVSILFNSIFANDDLGIDLGDDGLTLNDGFPDADDGANRLQNHPVLESATRKDGQTVIKGTLESAGFDVFRLCFYSDSPAPGETAEGKRFLTQISLESDGVGEARFRVSTDARVKPGQRVTATASDLSAGDTSEFSPGVKVKAARR